MEKPNTILFVFLLSMIFGFSAFASKGSAQSHRLDLNQAQAMASAAQSDTGFPLVMNDLVLKQLNRYLGTDSGRKFMRSSLARMETHRQTIEKYLNKYDIPKELLAIPIIESGYKNSPQKKNKSSLSAGLWQFIPGTARRFGLTVDENIDERLNIELNSDAAIRYLKYNFLHFKDWHLAILAYNMGEKVLQRRMNALKTDDPWTLIRKGRKGDQEYLAKLLAVIIIMRNPSYLKNN